MNGKPVMSDALRERDHLQRLRDFLDLPFNSLKNDELIFLIGDEQAVVASYIQSGHLSLVCEIAKLDALSANDWRRLLLKMSAAHDYAFPASLVTLDGKLALVWGCDAGVDTNDWIRRAEDALMRAFDIYTSLRASPR